MYVVYKREKFCNLRCIVFHNKNAFIFQKRLYSTMIKSEIQTRCQLCIQLTRPLSPLDILSLQMHNGGLEHLIFNSNWKLLYIIIRLSNLSDFNAFDAYRQLLMTNKIFMDTIILQVAVSY